MTYLPARLVTAACVLSLLSVAPLLQAQPSPAEQYSALRKQYHDLDAQLGSLQQRYPTAAPTEQEEIRKTFGALVEQVKQLLPQLQEAGLAAYKAQPNADEELTKLLVGLTANAVRSDRYEDAAGLAKLLIDNNCSEAAIYSFAGAAAYGLDDFETAQIYLQKAKDAGALDALDKVCAQDGMGQMYLTDADLAKKLFAKESEIRQREAAANDNPIVLMKTSKGDLKIELYENEAPQTVGNFISLVEKGFYNGLTFHRVLPNFMAQGGCPDGTGAGGPGYEIYCECGKPEHRNHFRGTLSMAHAGKDTGGSQFFLTFRRTSHLDGVHTVFGRVVEGLEVLAELQRIDPQRPTGVQPDKIISATVVRKRAHEYKPTKVEG